MDNNYYMDIVESKVDYENFKALCPNCNEWNIFNRVSDLKTTEPIWGKDVFCQFCNEKFRIGNDEICTNYQKLIFDCIDLKSRKEYMQIIINLSIAYEMFFSLILFYFLVEKVNTNEENKDKLKKLLNAKIEKYTFSKLYNEFLKLLFWANEKEDFKDSCVKCYIEKINGNKPQNIDGNIIKFKNRKILHYIYYMNKLDKKRKLINYLRNTVVHKQGYRPSLKEVEKEYKIARTLILRLDAIIKNGSKP